MNEKNTQAARPMRLTALMTMTVDTIAQYNSRLTLVFTYTQHIFPSHLLLYFFNA